MLTYPFSFNINMHSPETKKEYNKKKVYPTLIRNIFVTQDITPIVKIFVLTPQVFNTPLFYQILLFFLIDNL